jgi:mRNA-degrading endonuclease RelE of RelBE toxin-antitoxin system
MGRALAAMEVDPFAGDIRRLGGRPGPSWRRRVGDYRILFSVWDERRLVIVEDIVRRTSQSYER